MSIKIEKTKNANELKLSFEIEAEKFDSAIKKVYEQSAKYFNIPGFRKGKAPMAIVEKTYGTSIFYEDAFNEVVPEVFEKELKENNIEAVSRPDLDIEQMEKGKNLKFTAIIQTKPEVKLGKYKGIQIKKIEYNVSDEDIEHELGHMAERNSRIVSVENRPVEKGDITVIDFEGSVDGVKFEGGKADGHELEIGSGTFIPGFEDQIIGMKQEEEKDIKVKFPDDYFSEELKGKDAIFKVKLHEIKKKELPEINDDFAKDASEFDTLEELKNSIKEKLEEDNKARVKYETEEEAIKTVCEDVTIDIPSGMIETELDNMTKEVENRLRYQGMNMDMYLNMIGKTMEDFRKEGEEQAKQAIKTRLVLEQIIKEENIEPKQEKIDEKLEEMAKTYGKTAEELKQNENFMEYIKKSLAQEEVISFLVQNAKIK
ncbi:MAG: trigger factor [Clostridia bacterium]|jgi:trigger factor|nr:trigger factor [Clostridia bacterium]